MDFETIKNNAMNAFRQLSVLRVIVTSPNEKVADVPALYALPPSKRKAFEQEHTNPNRDEPLKGAPLFFSSN